MYIIPRDMVRSQLKQFNTWRHRSEGLIIRLVIFKTYIVSSFTHIPNKQPLLIIVKVSSLSARTTVIKNGGWLNTISNSPNKNSLSKSVQSTNSTGTVICRLTTHWVHQLSKIGHFVKFLRRFDSSTNDPVNAFESCLRTILYMTKASLLTAKKQFLRKRPFFFKTQTVYVLRNLNTSVALYGWKTVKLETEQ